jgi:hypothetical protein
VNVNAASSFRGWRHGKAGPARQAGKSVARGKAGRR